MTTAAQSDINAGPATLTAHDFLAIDSSLSDEERLIARLEPTSNGQHIPLEAPI